MWGLILRGKSVSLDLRISLLPHETSPFHDNILSHVVFVQLLFRQPCCEIIMNELSLSFLREIFFLSSGSFNLSAFFCSVPWVLGTEIMLYLSIGSGHPMTGCSHSIYFWTVYFFYFGRQLLFSEFTRNSILRKSQVIVCLRFYALLKNKLNIYICVKNNYFKYFPTTTFKMLNIITFLIESSGSSNQQNVPKACWKFWN